jgi:hypothetical protein
MHEYDSNGASVISLASAKSRAGRERQSRLATITMDGLLTKKEMAADIRVSTRTLDRYAKQRLIPYGEIRVSHTGATARRYDRSAVREALGLPDVGGQAPNLTATRKRALGMAPQAHAESKDPVSRGEFERFKREMEQAIAGGFAQIQAALDRQSGGAG